MQFIDGQTLREKIDQEAARDHDDPAVSTVPEASRLSELI